ncbi:MAG: hypothetical protein HY326_04690 [Chloroflexi bacterium]|nr:hypothetical protein [Chloroflexota bacterium]
MVHFHYPTAAPPAPDGQTQAQSAANSAQRQQQVEGANGVQPTNIWVSYYGSALAGSNLLPAGTIVQAIAPDGQVCGAVEVTRAGSFGLLPCYGPDGTEPNAAGPHPGDTIRLVANGVEIGTGRALEVSPVHTPGHSADAISSPGQTNRMDRQKYCGGLLQLL